jgi:eukaryotic translation initiation factor 2C
MPPRAPPPSGGPRQAAPVADHVTTIGVRRGPPGSAGQPVEVLTNHFKVKIPTSIITHYDGTSLLSQPCPRRPHLPLQSVSPSFSSLLSFISSRACVTVILPAEKALPARMNMDLITALQTRVAPDVFTPRAVYDGRKNLFAAKELKFPDGGKSHEVCLPIQGRLIIRFSCLSTQFEVSLGGPDAAKGPKAYRIRLTKVAEINPEVLHRFLQGKQSHDNAVLTAITALNVVIRMEPTMWGLLVTS